jgi:acetate kinase
MRRLSWLGVEIASEANAKGKTRISREASRVACFVIPTDEELMIARHTLRMLREQPAAPLRERRA